MNIGTETAELQRPQLRTSSYTIYVDLPGNEETMLLVHGYTGAFDKVSQETASFLRSQEDRAAPKLLYGAWKSAPTGCGKDGKLSEKTIEVLKLRGYLTDRTSREEEDFVASLASRLYENRSRSAPSYMFMPTYDCNLRCPYCFQDYMRTDQRYGHLLKVMQPAMVDRIFSAIPSIEASHGFEQGAPLRDITFFGGEPLLETSRPVVERIVESALRLGPAKFSAITNGTELLAYEGLLSPQKISSLQITIDGPPEEHNRRRVRADGKGTYESIIQNIRFALDEGVLVGVRINVDRVNIASLPALVDDFTAQGLYRYPNFKVYAAVIRPENPGTDVSTTFSTWELGHALSELAKEHPQTNLIFHNDARTLNDTKLILSGKSRSFSFRESYCSSHSSLYIFDAFGDVYVCLDCTGDREMRLGQIDESGRLAINFPIQESWRTRSVASAPACRRCRYALLCGGGCAVLAHRKTGKYHSNFCDDFSFRFRSQVAEAFLGRGEKEAAAGTEVPCG
jgi:uncharacterized protein